MADTEHSAAFSLNIFLNSSSFGWRRWITHA